MRGCLVRLRYDGLAMPDIREDRNDGDISGVDSQDENDSDEIPDDPINLIPFALPHQDSKVALP